MLKQLKEGWKLKHGDEMELVSPEGRHYLFSELTIKGDVAEGYDSGGERLIVPMFTPKIGYKAIAMVGTKYMSIAHETLGHVSVEYRVGEWAQGWGGTPLFLFESKSEAYRYCRSWVFQCEYQEYPKKVSKVPFPALVKMGRTLTDFWEHPDLELPAHLIDIPSGTILAKAVKLLGINF